jgi:hypothetical protein
MIVGTFRLLRGVGAHCLPISACADASMLLPWLCCSNSVAAPPPRFVAVGLSGGYSMIVAFRLLHGIPVCVLPAHQRCVLTVLLYAVNRLRLAFSFSSAPQPRFVAVGASGRIASL